VEGGDQECGRIGSWAGALLRQRKQRRSGPMWFGPGIKRNLEWAAVGWARNKKKSGASIRDQMTKT
jgi:hypothetical protein